MEKDARTEKLYLRDTYTASFEASLLSCNTDESGRITAVLDKTCFYPDSGGQSSDRGTIAGCPVIDVWEDESGTVYHQLASPVDLGGVQCQIDWDRRFDHMQQHTGQHVLSRAFIETAGLKTSSFHLGDDVCTIDLVGGALSEEIIDDAEAMANSVVLENRRVVVKTGSPEDMTDASLRKSLPEGIAEVRLVEVDGFDTVGCCGTHVRRSGELGVIKILKHEKAKGAHRVSFVVGRRAIRDYARKHDILKQLANRFTTSVENVEEKVGKLQAENQRFRKDAQALAKKLAGYEADRLRRSAVCRSGRSYVVEVISDASEEFLRLVASQLKSTPDTVSLLGTKDGLVICNASAGIDIDFSKSVIERAKKLGGSGGGKGAFATARLPESVQVAEFIEKVFEEIENA